MFWFRGFALIGAGVMALWNAMFGTRAKARRRLQRGAAGLVDREIVTLVGTVRQVADLLVSPLSGKSCVLYDAHGHLKVLEIGDRYARSVGEIRELKMVPFELDTGDGVVLVEGERPDLELPPIPVVPRKIDREVAFFEAHDQPRKLLKTSSCDELIIAPGDRIAVQGMAIVELDPTAPGERGYREDAPRKIRIVAHADHPLTIGRARR